MIAATGVSRTVVREAVAALRADGLVVTVRAWRLCPGKCPPPSRIAFDRLLPLRAVLEVMELRTGIEIEAAGPAAERATPAQVRKVVDLLRRRWRGDPAR